MSSQSGSERSESESSASFSSEESSERQSVVEGSVKADNDDIVSVRSTRSTLKRQETNGSYFESAADPAPVQPQVNNIPADNNNNNNNNVRLWERVWSLDELRKGTSNWTLASDAGVSKII
jgi:hypothetical protein